MCYVQGFTDEAVAGFSVRRDGRLPGWGGGAPSRA